MHKFKEEEIIKKLQPLVDAARPNFFFVKEPDLSFTKDKKAQEALETIIALLSATISAFFQLHTAYEDTIITLRMSRRFPWRKTEIRRSKHLSLVWFQFVNQCYLFKEKAKLFSNQFNRAIRPFGMSDRAIDVPKTLKIIDKALGREIRSRGSSLHEWYEEHENVHHFAMIEIINTPTRTSGPLGDVEGHYSDAKFFLSNDIKRAIHFMEDFLITIIDENISTLTNAINKLNATIQKIRDEGEP